jgi:branched-chain amino acid transport system substrate-binding protein
MVSKKKFRRVAKRTTILLTFGAVFIISGLFTSVCAAGSASKPTGEPIIIGLPLVQSGPVGVADHQDWLNGTKLAIKEINAAGGVLGRPLEIKIADTDILTPEGTIAGFQSLADDKIHAFSSPFVLIPTPAMDVAAAYKAPYLHGNTQEAGVALFRSDRVKYSNVFQVDPSEPWYGTGFIIFLDNLRASKKWTPINRKIHIVQGQIAYCQLISKTTQEAIEKSDFWQLGKITDVQSPIQDWGPVIHEIKRTGAGVVMIDHWVAAELAAFTQQFSANPLKGALVYLQYGPSQPEFLDIAGKTAEGFIWSTVYGAYNDEIGAKFRAKYKAEFPGTMGLAYTGGGYDTTYIFANAWKAVGDPNKFKEVSDYIRATPYRGVNGWYTFNNENQASVPYPDAVKDPEKGMAHLYFQVQGRTHKIIEPAPYKESEFVPAPWMK